MHDGRAPRARRAGTARVGVCRAHVLLGVLVCVAASLAGCGPGFDPLSLDPDVAPPDAGAAEDATPAAVVDAAPGQLSEGLVSPRLDDLAALPLLGRLPVDTPAVVALAPPIIWNTQLDLAGIVDALGPLGERLRTETREALGADLTDPVAWRKVWLDATVPLTMAVLEIEPLTIALGAGITDPDAVRTMIHALHAGRHRLRESVVDDTTFVGRLDGYGAAYAWRRGELWVVFGRDLARGEAFSEALGLLRTTTSLAGSEAITEALERLGDPRGALALVNVPAILERGLRTSEDEPRLRGLLDRENHKRRFDEFPGANRLMGDRLRLQTLDLALRPRTVSEQLLRAAFYPFGPAAFGLDVEATSARLTYVQQLIPGSLPATVFRPGVEAAAERLLDGEPALRFGVSFDPRVSMSIARALALVANRGDIAEFEARLRGASQVDLRRDLLDLSKGVAEVAVHVDRSRFEEPVTLIEVLHRVGAVARWAVIDSEKMLRSLERIERAYDWIESAGPGRFVLDLPGVPQIRLQVADDAVYGAFGSKPLTRLVTGESAAEPTAVADGGPPAPVDRQDAGVAAGSATRGDGGVADGGAVSLLEATARLEEAVQASERAEDDAPSPELALHLEVHPPWWTPVAQTVGGVAELGAGQLAGGPGSFAFERRRLRSVADVITAVELEAIQSRDFLRARLEIDAKDGLSPAVIEMVRASFAPLTE